ncbi:MAG: hypothetical protein A2636_01380 [Elusimicrobia bacterium RIFCSPHIGHO2_01_FULL_64_10]|nr:MAG: hypothetical protein A2636_01380 [Elusimicrobia bacterium RIFCSPHIGHO2_01_FULL_64_10]
MPGDHTPRSKIDPRTAGALREFLRTAEDFGETELYYRARRDVPKGPPRAESLEELYARYSGCLNCVLGKSRKKIVFGMGSLRPKVLFIGEGPGYEEDRKGLPFVGKAGELLDRILAAIGLSRETVYIANIVKCHPMREPEHPDMRGNDRPPLPEEMEACRPILEAQIRILAPPVICALGATAARSLLRTGDGITRLRGKVYGYPIADTGRTVPLVPTFHPAALLRDPSLKKDAWKDMKLLRGLIPPERNPA